MSHCKLFLKFNAKWSSKRNQLLSLPETFPLVCLAYCDNNQQLFFSLSSLSIAHWGSLPPPILFPLSLTLSLCHSFIHSFIHSVILFHSFFISFNSLSPTFPSPSPSLVLFSFSSPLPPFISSLSLPPSLPLSLFPSLPPSGERGAASLGPAWSGVCAVSEERLDGGLLA